MSSSDQPFAALDHASMIGPEGGLIHNDEAEVNDDVVRTLYVSSWPNRMDGKILDEVFTEPTGMVDVSIYQDPIPRSTSISQYGRAINQFKTQLNNQQERDSENTDSTRAKLQKAQRIKRHLEDGETRMHHVAVYVTIRAPSEGQVDTIENKIKTELTPPQLKLKRARYQQVDGALATSPVALDKIDYTHQMPSTALSTLFPFTASTIVEPSGVLLGYHATTDAPVMVDRFDRSSGFNVFITGKTGNGKSFGSKLMLLRRRITDPDALFFIVDPLSDFTRFVDKMDGENIPIGGTRGVNPMDIRETPAHVVREADGDYDPFGQKQESVRTMFNDYFDRRGFEFNTERSVLDEARQLAYERAGITSDISTHGKPSPTIRPVEGDDRHNIWDILGEIIDDPTDPIPRLSEHEVDSYRKGARELRMALRGFHEGQPYGHLGGTTDISLDHPSQVVNLDLRQNESSSDLGMMMKQLLDSIYQIAKTTPKKVILVIDECHKLLDNEYALDWLQRVVRYSRHHDLSLHLATQNTEDFATSEQRRSIVKNSAIGLHWKEDLSTRAVGEDGLFTQTEADFIRGCKPGDPEWGFSHALLKTDGQSIPVKVTGLREEENLIDESFAEARGVE